MAQSDKTSNTVKTCLSYAAIGGCIFLHNCIYIFVIAAYNNIRVVIGKNPGQV